MSTKGRIKAIARRALALVEYVDLKEFDVPESVLNEICLCFELCEHHINIAEVVTSGLGERIATWARQLCEMRQAEIDLINRGHDAVLASHAFEHALEKCGEALAKAEKKLAEECADGKDWLGQSFGVPPL